MESDCDDIAPNRSKFRATALCIAVAVAIVLAGVFVAWPWYINRLISQDAKERILAADQVVITVMRPDDPNGGPSVFPVMGSQFMQWMADAVEFGDIQPDMGPLTGDNWSELRFSESGSATLTLKVCGTPSETGESTHTFLVGVEDHITNRKVTVYGSDKIYKLVEMVRKMDRN
ncbi:MAG: hypothetical protein QGH94_03155 [Phycisphaerae bacterium]|jgi:hypothetical protein|nr:hypothetical protein [Phycisphaerae bacterium]MDP7286973.1 hypothetical protein [Phycisphaerae bacterium]